jgi:hypothetical protein
MNRKAFRCGVLALLLTAAFALPAISQTSTARAKPGLHSSRPAAPRGIVERTGGAKGGLHALRGANRGGIDPNGAQVAAPPENSPQTPAYDSGDNRGGIDPNG